MIGLYPAQEIESFTRLIFESVCGWDFTEQVLNCHNKLNIEESDRIVEIVSRLKKNEPIQYVLEETVFMGLKFSLNTSVLIPRPETEELVNLIIKKHSPFWEKIIDVGTGSGCISITLKNQMPDIRICGVDISLKALDTAGKNAALNKVDIELIEADILNWKELQWKNFDVIVSNPPYVCENEKNLMQKNVLDYEPESALFVPDNDPLKFYRAISDFACKYLHKRGKLFFEINERFGNTIREMLEKRGFTEIEILTDLSGKERFIVATLE